MSHIPHKIKLATLSLPTSYLNFLERYGNSQWIYDDELVFLWAEKDLESFNDEYRVHTLAPDLILIGSDGSGEAFGFDLRSPHRPVVQVPFVGLSWNYANVVANGFGEWQAMLAPREDRDPHPQMQVAEVKPVLFGGDPTDSANRAWLTRAQHFEYVRFWNDVFLAASAKLTPQ